MASTSRREILSAALAQFTNAELDSAIAGLGEGDHIGNLAQVLNVKTAALRVHPNPSSLVWGRVRSGGPVRAAMAASEISGACADACIDDLGDERSDDPQLEDMLEVLPPLLEEFGSKLVVLMLASYLAMDAPCADVFETLLTTDDRFAIGEASADSDAAKSVALTSVSSPIDTNRDEIRALRKASDAKKKDAARKSREAKESAAAALKAARKAKQH